MAVIKAPDDGGINTDFILKVSGIFYTGPAYCFKVYFTNGTDAKYYHEDKDTLLKQHSSFMCNWFNTVNANWRQMP